MSSKDFDPRAKAAEEFLVDQCACMKGASVTKLLDVIDRAKDNEITRLRKIIDDAGLCR